ncbi:hypothetical protein RHGRI_019454 [Rhododendron griersonianum]|uniref:F-box domain-containing protein n=1 Tax=Rhododendron griersonianum TaxID=479676 RepID=A0AAV6JCH9_9ERIC|nr:hypothetical protein RHGRI_019454 [Rhododendron griersonianum]
MTGGKVPIERVGHTHYKTAEYTKEKKRSIILSLPVEIIFNILVWIPADILYNSMRYVCRQWYNIVCDPVFIQEQLIHSSVGLIVDNNGSVRAQYFEVGNMNATRSIELGYPFRCQIDATCDGLVLFTEGQNRMVHGNHVTNDQAVCVANPLTKQKVTLPPPPPGCRPAHFYYSLACSHLAREYKVVFTCLSHGCQFFDWMVVTVGKDQAWRLIDSKKLSDLGRNHSPDIRLSTVGFLYLIYDRYVSIVALDVQSETFYEFPGPTVPHSSDKDVVSYLVRRNYLSCIVRLESGTLLDVWELSDPMSGGWRKLYTFDFDVPKYKSSGMFKGWFSRRADFTRFLPKAWVNNGQVVVFRLSHNPGPFIAHNVETGATFLIGSRYLDSLHSVSHGYAWSLVSLSPI